MAGRLGTDTDVLGIAGKGLPNNPKLAQAQADAQKAQQESDGVNSFGGLLINALKAVPKQAVNTVKNIGTGIVDSVLHPDAEQQNYESQTLPRTTGTLGRLTNPGVTIARGITRVLNPALRPLANDIADAQAVKEKGGIAEQVAAGRLPASVLDEYPALNKKPLQVVGDTAQAVLSAYAGGEAENLASQGVKRGFLQAVRTGAESGLKTGTAFGTAQALSNGSKNPLDILGTVGTAGAGGAVLGATTGVVGATTQGVLNQAKEAKALYDSQTPQERQAGFIKNPLSSAESSRAPEEPVVPTQSSEQATSDQQSSAQKILVPGVPTSPNQAEGRIASSPTLFDPEEYVKEQVVKREGAKTQGNPGIIGKAKSFLANAKSKMVDFTAPIEDVLSDATKKNGIKLLPTEDIHNQIDRVLRSPTLAGQFAKDNGMVDIIRKTDNLDNLDQYLIAKHAVELDTRGIETGRDLSKDQALVKAFAPTYEAEAQKVGQYSKNLLDYSVKTGLVSKELADTLKARYPDYVPFNRVFSEEEISNRTGNKAVASLSKQTAVQKIEGSTREVESPIQSLLAKTNDVFTQGEKNLAAKMLAGYEKLPGNPFELKELEPGDHADHTISFFDDGEKRTYSTTKEIADAAKALNVQQMNILGKIFAFPTRIARIGITGINLPFIGANLAKDQITGFINSDKALQTSIANPVNFSRALFSAVAHDDLYQEMVRAGGAGTSFDISRDQAPQTLAQIRAGRSIPSRIAYTVTHPSQLLRAVENIVGRSEEVTRLQQYRGTKQALLKQGMGTEDAIAGGARQARDATVNFARRGEYGTVLNSTFLYLNAGIQGTRTLLRGLKDRPLQTASKIAVSAMFPVAVATAWNLSDPKRKQAYEDIPEYEKQGNIIVIPPNPTQDANGKWNVIKVPLSQEINNLVSLPREFIEQASGLDPVKFKDFSDALLGTVSPINPTQGSVLSTLTPQAIKPIIEGAVNKNLFTGYPEVSDSLSKLSPEKQIKADTSTFAKTLGQQLGVSPIKIDAFVRETFGGVGSQLTGQQNVLDAVTARFGKAASGASDRKASDEVNTLLTKQADKSAELKSNAEAKYQELKALPKEQAMSAFDDLAKSDPTLAQKVADVAEDEKLGLSYEDKLVKQLQVENGERAKFIADKLNALGSKEEKKQLWEEYSTKKIITKNVATQILKLLK